MSRTPKHHDRSLQATPTEVLQFARYCETGVKYLACIRRTCNDRPDPSTHCSDCAEHMELCRTLVQCFQLPAVIIPYNFDPPPASEKNYLKYWREALDEAIQEAWTESR